MVAHGRSEKLQRAEQNWDLSLCLFVGFPCINWTLPLFHCNCCLPRSYTRYVRTRAQTRELLALTLVGKHTHTHQHTRSSYRRSRPSGPRFPVQHLAQTAVCRGEETRSLIRRTWRHSGPATDTQHRSTPIKENCLSVKGEDTLHGSTHLTGSSNAHFIVTKEEEDLNKNRDTAGVWAP